MVGNKQKDSEYKVVSFSYSKDTHPHPLFIKQHYSKSYDEEKPYGKTLFVVNIPPYVDKDNLERLFSDVGSIRSIELHRGIPSKDSIKPEMHDGNGFQTSYIVYNGEQSLQKALRLTELKPLTDENNKILTGLLKFTQDYNSTIYNPEVLREKATKVIKDYDSKEEEMKEKHDEVMGGDGWTVISSKGRNPGFARKESVHNKLAQKQEKKMSEKTLKNFYSFQIREEKKKQLAALRESFENQKQKVEELKKRRSFKPYS